MWNEYKNNDSIIVYNHFMCSKLQWLYRKLEETEGYIENATNGKRVPNPTFEISVEILKSKIASYNQCKHVWVRDLIDIDPDRAMEIVYCELCEKSL